MRNAVDACCSQCNQPFRWLCGTPLRCPNGHDLNAQPVTLGQYREEKAAHLNAPKDIPVAAVSAARRNGFASRERA
jgi:hypothetical protein